MSDNHETPDQFISDLLWKMDLGEYPLPIITEVLEKDMVEEKRTILVIPYLGGQYRIQITDPTRGTYGAPPGHGDILQEL